MTRWKERKDGEFHDPVMDVSDEFPDVGSAILYVPRPDWVRIPADIATHGGKEVRVTNLYGVTSKCPQCSVDGVKEITETEVGLYCMACPACSQFIWFWGKS